MESSGQLISEPQTVIVTQSQADHGLDIGADEGLTARLAIPPRLVAARGYECIAAVFEQEQADPGFAIVLPAEAAITCVTTSIAKDSLLAFQPNTGETARAASTNACCQS